MQSRGDTLAWIGAGGAVLIAFLLVWHGALLSPRGGLILEDETAPWIMVEEPVSGSVRQWGETEAPRTRFATAFRASEVSGPVRLRVRAFGEFRVVLNGAPVGLPAGATRADRNWRRAVEVEVSELLRAGENRIQVEVRNLRGPALLSLRLEGTGVRLRSDTSWTARIDDGPDSWAVPASDVRPHPSAVYGESPFRELVRHGAVLVVLGLAFGGAFAVAARRGVRVGPAWVAGAFGVVALGWLILFAVKFRAIDLDVGFDAPHHLEYVAYLLRNARVPLSNEGFAAYHPPLFYLLSAGAVGLGELVAGEPSAIAPKILPFVSGLGLVWVSLALARRLYPTRPTLAVHATLFAGVLPMNLYVAAYFTNEGFHAFLAGAALLVAVDLVLRREPSLPRTALLSTLLGLALLTKYTALVVIAVAACFVGVKIVLGRRHQPGRVLGGLVVLALPALIVAGWFYARNLVELGRVLVPSYALAEPPRTWWSPPGFHSPEYYLSFGESLVRPYLSAFRSFWDALYSTLWGDGMLAARRTVTSRHAHWNYEWMAAGYALALPATLLLVGGLVRIGWLALRDPEPRRRAALGLVLALVACMGFVVFYLTFPAPYVGQAKAFYGLVTVPALALAFALGVEGFDRWLAANGPRSVRVVWFGWLGTLLATFYLGFAA